MFNRRRVIRRITNYRKRFGLLKSGFKRIVLRKTNRYLIVQLINFNSTGDLIQNHLNSKMYSSLKIGFKNILVSYIMGIKLGLLLQNVPENSLIFDIGQRRPLKGKPFFGWYFIEGFKKTSNSLISGKILVDMDLLNSFSEKKNFDLQKWIKENL